jgi:RNA polymerase sigma factor (sigma-70 family)
MARRRVLEAVPADAAPADVAVLASESRREVIDAVRSLPQRQRECVVLRYFEECSTAETAAALGIGEGAVKTHLHRGLKAMEEKLEATR